MPDRRQSLEPGLYFVATPIGSARDITLRALDILAAADVLAAEDTRRARHLLDIHGIALAGRPLVAYHDHNGAAQRPRLLSLIEAGKTVAYVSDAGTPLVSDPGFTLAREAVERGLNVHAAPGPSALLAALTVAGLPTDRFFFAGFPPQKAAARRRAFAEFADVPGSLVFFESAKRIHQTLSELVQTLGEDRQAALCRELTKRFEETRRGTLAELAAGTAASPPKGEIVLVVGPPGEREATAGELAAALEQAFGRGLSLRDAVAEAVECTGLARKTVYRAALERQKAANSGAAGAGEQASDGNGLETETGE